MRIETNRSYKSLTFIFMFLGYFIGSTLVTDVDRGIGQTSVPLIMLRGWLEILGCERYFGPYFKSMCARPVFTLLCILVSSEALGAQKVTVTILRISPGDSPIASPVTELTASIASPLTELTTSGER